MKKKLQEKHSQPHILYCFTGRLQHQLDSTSKLGIAKNLSKFDLRVSLASADDRSMEFPEGVEGIYLPVPDIYIIRNLIYHLKLIWYILNHWRDIDVIFFGQPSAPYLFLLKLWRHLRGSRFPLFVLDTRTVPMEDPRKATMRDKLRAILYRTMNFTGNYWADGQTCITQRMADLLKVPPKKLWGIWSSGVEVEMFAPAVEQRRWPVAGEPVQLAYIGVLHYERNLLSLCKATEMANAEGLNFELTLTGFGTEQEDLKQFAAKTEGRVRVHDPVPHSMIPLVLAKAHIGVLPFPDEQKYRVCSPIKLFEYLAAGLPILATRIVCHTDVIKDQPAGFWAEEASPEGLLQALRQIWTEREQLAQVGQVSRMLAGQFTWRESARRLSEALHYGINKNIREMKINVVPGSEQ